MKQFLPVTLIFLWCSVTQLAAQLTVTSSTNATQLANLLAGPGVTISNATLNSAQGFFYNGAGTFSNGNATNLGLNSGVVLTSGDVTEVSNAASYVADIWGNGLSDPTLNTLSTPYPTYDRCVLEFDVVPIGDTLKFRYVFGSEEYPEYVCGLWSDVFGFFVTGQNPGGGNYTNTNIALVPGTNLPVSINTINPGTPGSLSTGNCTLPGESLAYSSYYTDNVGGTSIVFDGFTKVLTASIAVIPCQTYHLKLAIADVSDEDYDSGVFLEAGSFTSTNVTVLPQTVYGSGFKNAVEGCLDGQFKFSIPTPLPTNYTVNYTVGGSATNGIDYNAIPTSIVIPAGDTTAFLNIVPISDGLNEGNETIKLYLLNPCNSQPYDSASIIIQDSIMADASASRYFICAGETAVLTGVGGLTYDWLPTTGLVTPNSQTTVAAPTVTTTYLMTAHVGTCTGRDTLTIHVTGSNFTVDAGPNQTICANQTVQLQPTISTGGAPYTYQWTPTTGMDPGQSTQANAIVTPLQTTTYKLAVTGAGGCTLEDSLTITVAGAGPPVTATVTPSVICPGQQVQLDFTSTPQNCGTNSVGCGGLDRQDSVGVGYAVQTGSPTTNVTIYGNYFKSTRMQLLYTAAEINAVFGGAGTVKALAWEVGIFNSNATLENFTIRMKCVPPTTTTLSAWETGLQTVYGPKLYTPISGWNNHNLDTQYDWDGVSNLVIEICFYNPNTFSNFNNMMVYNTVANTVLYSRANTNQCGTATAPLSSNQRPKLRMRLCQPNYPGYIISWTPATGANAVSNASIRNPTANPMTDQTYQVNVTYNGCTGSDLVTVSIDTSVKVNAGTDLFFCTGQPVQLTATPSGSPLPGQSFSYQWTSLPANTPVGNTATVTVNPTGPTNYVVAMSGGPCIVYDTVQVAIGILGVSHQLSNITCNGANNGTIKLIPNGTAPYTYQWSANAATGNVDSAANLAPGTYYTIVTDAQNCIGKDTFILTQPTAITFTSAQKPISCNGGNDGRISVNPTGGTGAFSYNWSGGHPNNDTITGLTAGNYTLTISDANACSVSGSFTLTQPTAIAFGTPQLKDIRCFNGADGSITVSVAGGTSPYTYAWSQNANLNQATATNLNAGSYTITVTDANQCTDSVSYTLNQPANGLTITSITKIDVTCFGYTDGQATVNASGGAAPYTYLWNPGGQSSATATGLSVQTYYVTVTDDSLCTASDSITIGQPQQIIITDSIQHVLCHGDSSGAIILTVTPPNSPSTSYTYTWSNGISGIGTNQINGLTAGNYSVTVTNNHTCSATGSYIVTEPSVLSLNPPTLQHVSCFGGSNGSITASPSGGTAPYTYVWNPGAGNSATISNLTSGNYDVTVSDKNNCTVSATYTTTQPATPLVIDSATLVPVLCNGAATGTIAISASGGTAPYGYTWSHNALLNSSNVTALPAGIYRVTVADANACSVTASYSISQPTAISFANPTTSDVSCHGGNDGAATVHPSGGVGSFTYTWNGQAGSNPQTGLIAGNHTVVVTDSNNCTASTTVLINEPAALLLTPLVQDALCYHGDNGSIDANPSGGNPPFTFSWNDAQLQTSQVATALTAGTYTVTVTDNTNCTFSTSAMVGEPTELRFSLQTTQVSCVGDKDGTITVVANGATPPYNYAATQDGANFVYSTNGIITNLAPGYYAVIVSDNNGCTKVDTALVPDAIGDTYILTTDSTSCFGSNYTDGAVHISGQTIVNMPYQYSIDGGAPQYSGDFFHLSAGVHQVQIINNFGCTTDVQATVLEPVAGVADILPKDTTLQLGETIALHSSFGPYPTSTIVSYNWQPSVGLSCIDCANPIVTPYQRITEYTVTITYNDHCTASATMTIIVENHLEVYIPNAFTPNGDGNNDVFQIYGEGIKTIDLKIFNRWGEKVYETNNQFAGWDGWYRGQLQNPGVYVYEVSITFLDDKKTQKTGSVTLIR